MSEDLVAKALDSDILMTHQRFVSAMEGRLPTMATDQKERYFALLSSLVGKLEMVDKSMQQILQEMMSEAALIIMQEINAPR